MFRKRSTNRFEKLFSFETSKIDDKVSFAQFFLQKSTANLFQLA